VEEEDTFRQQQPLRDRSPQRSPKDDRKSAEALHKPLAASPAKKVTAEPEQPWQLSRTVRSAQLSYSAHRCGYSAPATAAARSARCRRS
jgi:hypothetical protein